MEISPRGEVPGNSSGIFKMSASTRYVNVRFVSANLINIFELIVRLFYLLVDIPISIRLAVKGIIDDVFGISGDILCIRSSVFSTVVSVIVLVLIVIFVLHL